ncbi:MAG: hypothetical protein WC211_00960 [Dehalococcoidia bacterium]
MLHEIVAGSVRPWRLAAVALVALALLLARVGPAEAAVGVTVTANASAASAASDLTIDVVFDAVPINAPATIVVTFPVGWTVPTSADLTAVGVSWAGLQDVTPTITSNAGARTISTTITVDQVLNGPAPAITLTIPNTSGLTNPAVAGSYAITVDAPGSAQGSGSVNITGGAPAVTGGAVTLSTSTVGANTAGTIAFTLGGALATGNSIVLTFPAGWTVADGAMTTGFWAGLDGAPASVTGNAAARTVTIVIGATAQTTLAETITITGSTQLVNPTTPAVGVSIGISATGQTAGTSNVFNITAGTPTQYTLTGPAAVNAGVASTNFTITIQDAFGNTTNTTQNTTFTLASTTAGTVTFAPVSPVTVTTGTSSVTFTYTATQAGSKTITATRASGDAVGGPQTANITVNAGAAAKLQLLVPGESASAGSVTGKTGTPTAQTTGTAFSVTVNMVDANWNVVTSTDTVGITSTDGGATLPANAALVAGTKTFSVTLNTVGTPTVTATDITNGAMTASVSPAITVAAPPPPPDEPSTGGGPPIVLPVACGQNQISDGNGGCVCMAGFVLVGINCVEQPRPKLTALALVPLTASGAVDLSVAFYDYPRADLTGGRTTFTLSVASGRSYGVAAEADSGTITYRRGGIPFDPNSTRLAAGDVVTIQAVIDAGTSPTYTLTLAAPVAQLTNAAVTLSSAGSGATGVTATITFTTPVDIPSGGKIKVTMTGFTWPATPAASFISGAGTTTVASAAFASNVLTITTSTAAINAGTVTLQVTGATNPGSQGARADVAMSVTSSADAVLASTSTGTMPAITVPSLSGVLFTTEPSAPNTATTIVVTFTPSSSLEAGSTIRLAWTDFTPTTGVTAAATFAGIQGTTATLSGVSATGATVTVGGAALSGGSPVTLRITGYTTPAAKTIAKAGLTVATSTVTTAVASSADVVIAAPLSVSISGPSTAVARPAGGIVQLATSVSGLGGVTPTYAWTATPAGCGDLVEIVNTSSLGVFVPATASIPECTFTVAVTIGSQTATASHTITWTAAPPQGKRLEIVGAPSGTITTIPVDVKVTVRVFADDGTPDTTFTGNVTLSARASGRTFTVGISRVSKGVATVSRSWTPQIADATWVLTARATGYDEVTSGSFTVTPPPPYLKFTTQPGSGTPGAALTTQPTVTAYNGDGTVNTSFNGSVSIVLKADTANGATLTATSTAVAGGAVKFTGVSVNNAGTGYVLVASATGYADIASSKFDVVGTPAKIVITQYTATAVAQRDSQFEVRAEVRDADDRLVSSAASGLQLRLSGNNESLTMASRPSRVVDGVAYFTGGYYFPAAGNYRWGVRGNGSTPPQADTAEFKVTGPPSKLAFVDPQPGGLGYSTLIVQPVVEIQDEHGDRVPGATNLVTLTLNTTGQNWVMNGNEQAAVAGTAKFTGVGITGGTAPAGTTFTLTASSGTLTAATSKPFGPAASTTQLAFAPGVPTSVVAGQYFSLIVRATDGAGRINSLENGIVTLTSDGNGFKARSAPFVSGQASFSGLFFQSANSTGFTLSAVLGAFTASTEKIVVTPSGPTMLVFTKQPTYEVNNVVFTTQPVLTLMDATSATFTGARGTITLSTGFSTITIQVPPTLDGTLKQTVTSGTATWTGLKALTGSEAKNVILTATWTDGTTSLTANSTPFDVYLTTAAKDTARAAEQSKGYQTTLRFEYDSSLLDNSAAASKLQANLQSDICRALNLDANACARVTVASTSQSLTSALRVAGSDGAVRAAIEVAGEPEPTVAVVSANLQALEAELGAAAPAGARALYAVGRVAADAYGNRLDVLDRPQRFSLPVPESVLLPGVLPGDLKVAWWDGLRWTIVPSATAVNFDGSFTVTVNTDALGAFAVLYAPGAGRVQGFGGFSTESGNESAMVGLGIFAGGSTQALAHAVGLNGADGVWVQDVTGEFRLLLANGPAFVSADFHRVFADGLESNTVMLLVRAPRA